MDERTLARAVAIGLTAAAAVGLVLGWRRADRRGRATEAFELWSCDCGQDYRVAGEGRHRVYWLVGAPQSDPILGTTCVRCERPLPA